MTYIAMEVVLSMVYGEAVLFQNPWVLLLLNTSLLEFLHRIRDCLISIFLYSNLQLSPVLRVVHVVFCTTRGNGNLSEFEYFELLAHSSVTTATGTRRYIPERQHTTSGIM
jgi:hypothetical protein